MYVYTYTYTLSMCAYIYLVFTTRTAQEQGFPQEGVLGLPLKHSYRARYYPQPYSLPSHKQGEIACFPELLLSLILNVECMGRCSSGPYEQSTQINSHSSKAPAERLRALAGPDPPIVPPSTCSGCGAARTYCGASMLWSLFNIIRLNIPQK